MARVEWSSGNSRCNEDDTNLVTTFKNVVQKFNQQTDLSPVYKMLAASDIIGR